MLETILLFLLREGAWICSASSSQRECVLTVANEMRLSTRRGKVEAKEPLFFGRGRGFYLRSVAFLCVVLRTRNCRRQTLSRLLAAASVATQKPSLTPLHVRGGDTALLAQSVTNLNLVFSGYGSWQVKFTNLSRYEINIPDGLCVV